MPSAEHEPETSNGAVEARSEPQFTQAYKMEVLGQLAAGITHDFNNLLAVILGQAGLLLNEPLSESQHRKVESIHRAGARAATLTRQLLAFTRREVLELRVFDLNALITDFTAMLRRLLREDIELVTRLATDLATIKADPNQIELAIINLAVNARDAMPNGGTLTIETAVAEMDVAGGSVLLAMADSGSGMTEAVKARLFEPFFTTKGPGRGTGLGLAAVHYIVTQIGGRVACESVLGRGTTFTISLPRVRAEGTSVADQWIYGDLPRGTETVLLVEDDGDVRETAREILAEQGYTVLDAADATGAFRISQEHPGPIHLLLTDVVMPGMSGWKLAEQLVAARPEMKVLYVSGYIDDAIIQSGVRLSELAFLRKPFTPLGFARKVRETLEVISKPA